MKVNLLNRNKNNISSFNWPLVIGICVLFIVLFLIFTHYWVIRNNRDILERENEYLEAELNNQRFLEREYFSLQNEIQELEEQRPEEMIINNIWGEVLLQIGYMIPQKVVLDRIDIEEDIIILKGNTENSDQVVNLINNLEKSNYFRDVKMEFYNSDQQIQFEINAILVKGG